MTRLLTTLALAAAVAVAGCSDDGSGPDDDETGTYELETIGGDPLPYVIVQIANTYKLEVLDGSITLRSNNTFETSGTLRETENGSSTTVTETDSGTYSLSGSTLILDFQDDEEPQTATLVGDRLTFTSEGLTFVFEK